QQRDAVVRIRKIGPALRRHLERRFLPAGVAVRRAVDRAELDVVRRAPIADGSWKCNSQQRLAFVPFRSRRKVDAWHACVHVHALAYAAALANAPTELQRHPFGSVLQDMDWLAFGVTGFRGVEGVDVPGVVVERFVFEYDETVRELTAWNDVALLTFCHKAHDV